MEKKISSSGRHPPPPPTPLNTALYPWMSYSVICMFPTGHEQQHACTHASESCIHNYCMHTIAVLINRVLSSGGEGGSSPPNVPASPPPPNRFFLLNAALGYNYVFPLNCNPKGQLKCTRYVYAYTFLKCVHVVFPLLLNMTSRDIMPHVGGK